MTGRTVTMNGGLALLVAAVLVAFAPQGTAAQDGADDRWLPWLGCWEAVDAPADAPLTCVRPSRDGGVELLSVTVDGVVERRPFRADGVERPLATEECAGSESAEFSADGTRVYLRGEQSCDGGHPRTTRGLIAMVDRDQWIEVQTMEVGGRSMAWMQRYAPASRARATAAGQAAIQEMVDRRAQAIRTARMFASAPITVDEVIEAYARTDAEAVRLWVTEQAYRIDLDARRLVRLANAGVPDDVIDVVVAVAYPEQFAIADADAEWIDRRPRRGVYGPRYPVYLDPYYPYYGRGWGGMGWGGYGYYRPPVVVIPRDGSTGGRVVQGRGYTRGTASPAGTPRSRGEAQATPPASTSRTPAATSTPPSRDRDRQATPRRAQPRNDD
jgi:hypothetical protein